MHAYGSARFATRSDLRENRLLPPWEPGTVPDGLLIGWWRESRYDFSPITYQGDLHQLIVGGTGGGKLTTALAPLLLGSGLDDQAVVVIDTKGEIAALTGKVFQTPFADRATVHLLDPWNVCGTGQSASLNFLDLLTPDNPEIVEDAQALAEALVAPSGNENTHWDHTARNFLTGLLLHVALSPKETRRDLVRVRELAALPWALPKVYTGPSRASLSDLLYSYVSNDLADGAIRDEFVSMINRDERERSGIISSMVRETAWIRGKTIAAALGGNGIDLKAAALGADKFFVIVPLNHMDSHAAWLRLCITAFTRAFRRHMPPAGRPAHKRVRHIVIDEFPTLGHMPSMLTNVATGRGNDIRYHLVAQDLNQLQAAYGAGWQTFINNSFQRFFAVSDMFTKTYVSQLLGQTTTEARGSSESTAAGTSRTTGSSSGSTTGRSDPEGLFNRAGSTTSSGSSSSYSYSSGESFTRSRGETFTEAARPLLTPDEVGRLSDLEGFITLRGLHPVKCWRPPYWTIFPSLPDFTLKDVLDTVGRAPVDDAERERFTAWRMKDQLFKPEPLPVTPAFGGLLPTPEPAKEPARKRRWALYAALVAGGLIAFAIHNWVQNYREQAATEAKVRAMPLRPRPARRRAMPLRVQSRPGGQWEPGLLRQRPSGRNPFRCRPVKTLPKPIGLRARLIKHDPIQKKC